LQPRRGAVMLTITNVQTTTADVRTTTVDVRTTTSDAQMNKNHERALCHRRRTRTMGANEEKWQRGRRFV